MWQLGSDPDVRPLRAEPVRREEVLVDTVRWNVLTMPLGTWTREERELVGDPQLWRSVMEEIAAERAAAAARRQQWYKEALSKGWRVQRWMTEPLFPLSAPEFFEWRLREYVCDHCGRGYLGRSLGRGGLSVCSDHCKAGRRVALRRRWRSAHPPASEQINAARTLRRAEARAGRVCAQCGAALEAERSTRRFCSDICRVKWHRSSPSPS